MLIIFGIPRLVWRLGRTDYFAPLVVVQIVAGILLGPGVLGVAPPDLHARIFKPEVILALNGLAWLAVTLFVWLAGIELDLGSFWTARRDSLTTARLALIFPLATGAAPDMLLLGHSPARMEPAAQDWQFVPGIGMALLRTPLGQRVLREVEREKCAQK